MATHFRGRIEINKMFSFNYARIEATINEISFSEGISTKFLRTAEMQAIAKTNMTKWLNQEYH